ncbi:MAG: hypothetical protein HYX89_08685 [Chloroflexi bacterium]|nr:hypothetical protein [Chloroflexota bacterium]
MDNGPRTVFVLGAGFTKAFLPDAPLLTDDYDGQSLLDKFKDFPHAKRILELELGKSPSGQINIERLMTRLDGRMPYDHEQGAGDELGLLLSEVKRSFVRRLDVAKKGDCHTKHTKELAAFARHCIENGITCITFNYDDVFDEELWKIVKVTGEMSARYWHQDGGGIVPADTAYWHPDGGYGFFCKPSTACVTDQSVNMDATSMLLLKLHGSINWRVKRGYPRPYAIDSIVHQEAWQPRPEGDKPEYATIELHLEAAPFIVPPVLVKSTLVEQPILRLVWSLAYNELEKAEQVVFVGYSFPVTDVAAGFLFGEALRHLALSELYVVNLASDNEAKKEIRRAYRAVFPGLTDEQFDFRGTLEWSRDLVSTESPAEMAPG